MEKENAERNEKKQELIRFVKFGLFSISAGVVQVLSFVVCSELVGLPYWPAYLIALILSVVYNFTVNRRFTFKSAANIPLAMLKVLGYYCVFTPLSTWWGDYLTDISWNEYIVLGGTMIINFVTEFLFTRYVVYRNSVNTNDLAKREAQRAQEEAEL